MQTEYTLILLKDGRNILISNEIPKDQDGYWTYIGYNEEIKVSKSNQPICWFEKLHDKHNYKTVISGYADLPTLTYSDEVRQVLIDKYWWVDVEELAIKEADKLEWDFGSPEGNGYYDFINGFKVAHQSITNKMFSYDDMMDIAGFCAAMDNKRPIEHLKIEAEEYIKRKQQPIQFKVEVDMEWLNPKTNQLADSLPEITSLNDNDGCYIRPKIINNSIKVVKIF